MYYCFRQNRLLLLTAQSTVIAPGMQVSCIFLLSLVIHGLGDLNPGSTPLILQTVSKCIGSCASHTGTQRRKKNATTQKQNAPLFECAFSLVSPISLRNERFCVCRFALRTGSHWTRHCPRAQTCLSVSVNGHCAW